MFCQTLSKALLVIATVIRIGLFVFFDENRSKDFRQTYIKQLAPPNKTQALKSPVIREVE